MDNSSKMKLSDFLTDCAKETTSISPSNVSGEKGFEQRIKIVIERMIQLGAIAAVFFLIWSGIQYTTAYGDDEKIKHAKSTATYALAGLLLLMASFGLVDILLKFVKEFIS